MGSERYESVRLAPGQHGQQNGVFINWYYFYTRDYLEYIIRVRLVDNLWQYCSIFLNSQDSCKALSNLKSATIIHAWPPVLSIVVTSVCFDLCALTERRTHMLIEYAPCMRLRKPRNVLNRTRDFGSACNPYITYIDISVYIFFHVLNIEASRTEPDKK